MPASHQWQEEQGDYNDGDHSEGCAQERLGEHETLKSDMLFGK